MARAARVVQVDKLCDQIYKLILDAMKDGTFGPGHRLLEVEMAERFGVSRTPVREALLQLNRDGLIQRTRKGFYIPDDTAVDLGNKMEIRLLLEPRIAYHAALEATPKELAELRKTMLKERQCHESGDLKGFVEANRSFNNRWHSLCKNTPLVDLANTIINQFHATRRVVHQSPENRKYSLAHHRKLFDAIKAGDAEKAQQLTVVFLTHLAQVLEGIVT